MTVVPFQPHIHKVPSITASHPRIPLLCLFREQNELTETLKLWPSASSAFRAQFFLEKT
jgi:hypothetical protein